MTWSSTFILKAWELLVVAGPWLYMLCHWIIMGFQKWRQQHQQMGGGGGGDM
jgi:hypothetical protein